MERVDKINESAAGIGWINHRGGFVGLRPSVKRSAAGQVGKSAPKCGADLLLIGIGHGLGSF